jgi:hypothetical protein
MELFGFAIVVGLVGMTLLVCTRSTTDRRARHTPRKRRHKIK